MALFQYYALTEQGRKKVGVINADSLELAKEELRRQKILVTKLISYKKEKSALILSPSLLINFTRDIHTLLTAGLPLYDSLVILEEKYRKSKAHGIFLDLCDQVKQGKNLSQALEAYPKVFDAIYLSLVESGQESGDLASSFQEIEKILTKEQALKKKILAAMIYPIFLGSFCLLVIGVLLFFLIPSMSELFEGRQLHPMTECILYVSQILNTHALPIFLLIFTSIFTLILFFKRKKGKKLIQKSLLHLPILKPLITESILSRFCRIFSVLLKGGIPILDALKLSKKPMKNILFEAAITKAEKKVMEGKLLSKELQKSSLIPNLVIRMLAIGEESGNIGQMMENVATIYEEDVEKSLSQLTSLLQPVMLLFLGIVVAIILLSVLMPLTDVGSFIQ